LPLDVPRWRACCGKVNKHVARLPRDRWIENWERAAIVKYAQQFPLNGYWHFSFLMLERDLLAVSPLKTYRVLTAAGLIQTWNGKLCQRGTGFVQPPLPHQH
jgi:hypothetical protein